MISMTTPTRVLGRLSIMRINLECFIINIFAKQTMFSKTFTEQSYAVYLPLEYFSVHSSCLRLI